MSKENLSKFLNQVADSEELQAQIGDEIDAESLIALGAECGCEFTEEDLQVSAEISEEELDAVAGGRRTIPPQNLKSKYQLKSAADLTSSTHPDVTDKLQPNILNQGSRLFYAPCPVDSPCMGNV